MKINCSDDIPQSVLKKVIIDAFSWDFPWIDKNIEITITEISDPTHNYNVLVSSKEGFCGYFL